MTISFTSLSSIGIRTVLFVILWWVITEGEINSWFIGAPVVVFAVFASKVLLPGVSLSAPGIMRFLPFYLWHSLHGGVDVARRALHPQLPISPVICDYCWRLPPGLPQVFMANIVSLLPGTLSVELDDEYLRIHVLDETIIIDSELDVLEKKVAGVFGLDIADRQE